MGKLTKKAIGETVLSIFLGLILILGMTGCQNKEEKKVILNENLSFEINEEIKLLSLISEKNEVEILSTDEIVDTSKLGVKEIVIKYKDDGKEKEQIAKINIIDTTAPTISFKKQLSTTEGKTINLLKGVKVSDNSKEKITPTIEGKYNINKPGTYKLKYVAVDSSNNKVEKDFTLKVNKKVVRSKKIGSVTVYFGKYKMEGDFPKEYSGTITINADGTATNTGYYYNSKGNFVKKNLKGKWSIEEDSIAGLSGPPSEINRVDGIHFSWNNGEKLSYGITTKYFGDQFHGYRWYSY